MKLDRYCVAAAITLITACGTDTATAPGTPDLAAVKFWESGAAVAWNARAGELLAARPQNMARLYAYLSLAQYRAAEAAAKAPGPHPPISAAIGGASAALLAAFFPLDATAIETALDAQQAADPWPGAKHASFAAGEAIGREIAAKVLIYAQDDRLGLTDPLLPPIGPAPTTPGSYVVGATLARGSLGMRPLFLASGDEFRPGPPPAFGSPEFQSAVAEVKAAVVNRTPAQLASALFWHANQSPVSNGPMNALARELIVGHRRGDLDAARVLFLANGAAYDALIACFDAKYRYWFLRPSQADPTIVPFLAFTPIPAHPSYPSAHSCISGGFTGVLALEFPSEGGRVEAQALEAAMSRVYAGIHYRFDAEVGLALGRAVAGKAVASDLNQVALLP